MGYVGCPRFEEVKEDGHIEGMAVREGEDGLHGSHHNQQEPSEGETPMHVTQYDVVACDAPVQQALAYHLPYCG